MSTMLRFNDDSLSNHFLSEEELKVKAPFIFTTEPTNSKVSGKYVQATTIDVVRDMAKLGWYPVEAKQCRAKAGSSGIRSFHMVAFQNPDEKIVKGNGEVECFPRIILTNSHDGFNSFKFMCGLLRCICSNGLILMENEMANFAIRHINYTFDELRKVVCESVKSIPEQVKIINTFKNVTLTDEQKNSLATEAIKIRKNFKEEEKFSVTKEELMDILNPVREEDNGDDLWSIFNVLQEKMIKGGFNLTNKDGKKRSQRGITSVKRDLEINVKLFEVANSYAS